MVFSPSSCQLFVPRGFHSSIKGLKSPVSSKPVNVTIRPSPSVMFEGYHLPFLISSMRVHCSVKELKMYDNVGPVTGLVPSCPPVTSKRPSLKKLRPEQAGSHPGGGATFCKASV